MSLSVPLGQTAQGFSLLQVFQESQPLTLLLRSTLLFPPRESSLHSAVVGFIVVVFLLLEGRAQLLHVQVIFPDTCSGGCALPLSPCPHAMDLSHAALIAVHF